ncbi:hypothetical protein Pla52o_08300 [Novipirellula galeiformis]|uniref:DUF447 family protein n=1 Tax=Novipirellula galeiformis TaxID=2528004 RepID=A0A5C6CTM9_9BACT|nr:DUF447 domain-containing protein [Novipirellula galeiformis]TWU26974.1 hypothetical protein Pla52o_08300 [Novipirellula galeiformis]
MILESIVTTMNQEGRVNIAPMGPLVSETLAHSNPEDETMVLRPFHSSRTFQNLMQTRRAVVHVTDDVDLFARAAVGQLGDQDTLRQWVQPIENERYWVLHDCHRWFAVDVESIDDHPPRADMTCRVIKSGIVRPFFGFNRAKYAVIEAAILATRTHLLPRQEVESELRHLQTLVDKTGGAAEEAAFQFLTQAIAEQYASPHPGGSV